MSSGGLPSRSLSPGEREFRSSFYSVSDASFRDKTAQSQQKTLRTGAGDGRLGDASSSQVTLAPFDATVTTFATTSDSWIVSDGCASGERNSSWQNFTTKFKRPFVLHVCVVGL
jgi:hypothetical protein